MITSAVARMATVRAYYRGWLPFGRRVIEVWRTQGWRSLWQQALEAARAARPKRRLYAVEAGSERGTRGRILIVSHALDETGAPRVVYEMARALLKEHFSVFVAAPSDGPIRRRLTESGVSVLDDPRLLSEPRRALGNDANFDRVIANSVVCWPVAAELGDDFDVYWYIHETDIIHRVARYFPQFRTAISKAAAIWAGTPLIVDALAHYGVVAHVLEYGAEDLFLAARPAELEPRRNEKVIISQFAAYMRSKAPDLSVIGMLQVQLEARSTAELHLFGAQPDFRFWRSIEKLAAGAPSIVLHDAISYAEYVQRISTADIVVVPSRDESFSYVALDALALQKPLLCSTGAGISAYLRDGTNALIAQKDSSEEIGQALERLISDASLRTRLGSAGRQVYERTFTVAAFRNRLREALDYQRIRI